MEEERKGFLGGSAIALILFVALMSLVSCAESQGYHRYDESGGYPARPGNGSARVRYVSDDGTVGGTTTTPENAIRVISEANMSDAQAHVIRTRADLLLECYRQHGSLCSIYPYPRYFAYPGHTRRMVDAVGAWKAERAANEARRRADEALRGAKRAARLSLETADQVERALAPNP